MCPRCSAAQGDDAVDWMLTSRHSRARIPPSPLAFRPTDGRPPRAEMGDWGEVIVPASWRFVDNGDVDEPIWAPHRDLARRRDDHLGPA